MPVTLQEGRLMNKGYCTGSSPYQERKYDEYHDGIT
jgi:hypothetical protein